MSESKRPHKSAQDWDDQYRRGNLPWDTRRPSAELVRVLDEGFAPAGRAVELGCGTGTNAIYLAQRGFRVTAIDLSPTAIDQARQRAQTAGVRVDFYALDVTTPPDAEPFDFVFDRGCYHCVRRENLVGYQKAVDRLTRAGSRLLLLAGNPHEDHAEQGPPRVHEQELRAEFAPWFDIQWMRAFRFEDPDGSPGPLAWSVGMVRRDA